MKAIKPFFTVVFFLCTLIPVLPTLPALAQSALDPYIATVQQSQEGMSLWQMIQTGGLIMVILAALSVIAMAFVVYNFLTLKVETLSPRDFCETVIQRLEKGKTEEVQRICESQPNIIAGIILSGLNKQKRGFVYAREAMEHYARQEIGKLWQNIGYLSDIASVAPLIGLLGTVLGMIKAFNVIAFQTAVVKPILLAGGVSQAMVTTAGGLIVAIPVMLFYSYFRGKVHQIAHVVETTSADIIKIMEEQRS